MRGALIGACLLLCAAATGADAVQPDEVLADPALEARAREMSKGLRCLVCRNESIDESNADLARDLRLLVRERLVAGDTDAEVIAFVVDRYGEYVLLNPPASGSTWLLWGAPLGLLLLGGALAVAHVRGQKKTIVEALSDEEQKQLDAILKDRGNG